MGPAAAMAGMKLQELLKSWGFWLVIFVIAFALYFYLKGKKAGKAGAVEDLKEDLFVPVDPSLKKTPEGSVFDPTDLTDRLYADIYSGIFTFRDYDGYKLLLSIPDAHFKMVANDWLQRYFDEDKETLKVAIYNENGDFHGMKDSLMVRFSNLGIK